MGNKDNKKRKLSSLARKKHYENLSANKKRLRKGQGLQDGDPGTSSGIPRDEREGSADKPLELCMKIKNSLKQLRRQSMTAEEETGENTEKPLLNLEVFPENPDDTAETLDPDDDIAEEPIIEFHDESETPKEDSKQKAYKFPAKPIKRNPRRKAVMKQEIQKSIIAARKAPAVEKIYVNSVENPEDKTKQQTNAKRPRLESEMPAHFSHTEKLYEFGKFIAEQMMCFDETDVSLAEAEIKEVIKKFRLKYKIMNCLSKPKEPETNLETETMTQPVTQSKSPELLKQMLTDSTPQNSKQSVTKPKPRKTPADNKPQNTPGYTKPRIYYCKPQEKKTPGFILTQIGKQMVLSSADPSVTPNAQLTTESLSIPNIQVNTGSSPQNGSQIAGTQSGLPQVVSVVPSLNEIVMSNTNSPGIPIGFVVVPRQSFQTSTQNVNSAGTIQPVSLHGNTSVTPSSSRTSPTGTSVTQPGPSHAIAIGSSVAQPENSDTTGPPFQMPPTHFIDVIPIQAEPESLIVKSEVDTDEVET